MTLEEKLKAFSDLGTRLRNLDPAEVEEISLKAASKNRWFTPENIKLSLEGIIAYLQEESLTKWVKPYEFTESTPLRIGIVMAGNIPLVGFHDFLTVLMSNHIVVAKLSSQDPYLLPYVVRMLIAIEPAFASRIEFVDLLTKMDAVIATGSDNSARYFHYYFGKIPHIIRKNRSSCGIIDGKENEGDYHQLGKDIFQYYGLGCRNISKVFVPEGYDFSPFLKALRHYKNILEHNKYQNNYDYNKSIYLVNRVPHLDTEFLLLTEETALVSPISVLFYEYYADQEALAARLKALEEKLQVIASSAGWFRNSVPFGTVQKPALWDYADGVDTMQFLLNLR